jgi:hypothetical protein
MRNSWPTVRLGAENPDTDPDGGAGRASAREARVIEVMVSGQSMIRVATRATAVSKIA